MRRGKWWRYRTHRRSFADFAAGLASLTNADPSSTQMSPFISTQIRESLAQRWHARRRRRQRRVFLDRRRQAYDARVNETTCSEALQRIVTVRQWSETCKRLAIPCDLKRLTCTRPAEQLFTVVQQLGHVDPLHVRHGSDCHLDAVLGFEAIAGSGTTEDHGRIQRHRARGLVGAGVSL